MILTFKEPGLSYKPMVDRVVREGDIRMCDQTFGNLYAWARCYGAEIAVWKDSFISRWQEALAAPLGPQRKEMMELLLEQGERRFIGIDDAYKTWLEETFGDRFRFKERRNSADYIYDREALETLRGKKLAAKRNHINYFENQFSWEVRPINRETMPDVLRFNEWWCAVNDCGKDASLKRESCAVRRGLDHFEALGFCGLALYADGKICAFTYGEPIGQEGFCVHVEKADGDLRGAYPMINREFVKSLPAKIRWINREDDTGDSGLRKAKLSYHPSVLLMKYEAEVLQ